MTNATVSYKVNVQDRDLKRLTPILRQIKRELQGTATTSARTGRAGAANMDRFARSTKHAQREVSGFTRGALAATGALRGMGRSLVFGSAAFLGGASLIAFLKSVVTSAQNAERSQKAMRTQFRAAGLDFGKYRAQVDATVQAQSKLAAVDDELVKDSFTRLLRVTGNVNKSLKLNALALDISAARHLDLEKSADLVGKVYSGNLGVLQRYGIVLRKGTTPLQALIELQRRFSGQAKTSGATSEGAIRRFGVAWQNIKEEVGAGVLPFLTSGLNDLSAKLVDPAFMNRAREIGRALGKDVAGAARDVFAFISSNWPTIVQLFKDAKIAAHLLFVTLKGVAGVLHAIAAITPGGGNTLIWMLATGLLARRILPVLRGLIGIGTKGKIGLLGAAVGAGRFRLATKLIKRDVGMIALGIGGWPVLLAATLPYLHSVGKGLGELAAKITGHHIVGDPLAHISPAAKSLGAAFRKAHAAGTSFAQLARDAAAKGIDQDTIREAIAVATGAGIEKGGKAGVKKLKGLFDSIGKDFKTPAIAQTVAKAQTILSQLQSRALLAFDAQTQRLLDHLKVVVKVGKEIFTIGAGQKTPAERELAALDKLEAKRRIKFDIASAKDQLQAALRFGDPGMIREAQDALRQAMLEKRRFGLEQKAEKERKAADAALERARKALTMERKEERLQLVERLRALKQQLASGKLAVSQAIALAKALARAAGYAGKLQKIVMGGGATGDAGAGPAATGASAVGSAMNPVKFRVPPKGGKGTKGGVLAATATRTLQSTSGGGSVAKMLDRWLTPFQSAFVPKTPGGIPMYYTPGRPLGSLAQTMPKALMAKLGQAGSLRLLGKLAQAEAHPRFLLNKKGYGVHAASRRFTARVGGDTYVINVSADRTDVQIAHAIRKVLREHAKRNAKQTRGPRAGETVGLS